MLKEGPVNIFNTPENTIITLYGFFRARHRFSSSPNLHLPQRRRRRQTHQRPRRRQRQWQPQQVRSLLVLQLESRLMNFFFRDSVQHLDFISAAAVILQPPPPPPPPAGAAAAAPAPAAAAPLPQPSNQVRSTSIIWHGPLTLSIYIFG